jgi:hypothetical protein
MKETPSQALAVYRFNLQAEKFNDQERGNKEEHRCDTMDMTELS